MATRGRHPAILIDDAHRLIHPVMGGLADFDRLIDVARRHSGQGSWVLAVDEVIWSFFERARGARPLFDDVIILAPWREEAIAALLVSRSRQAGIEPSFAHVVEKLPSAEHDEESRDDALARAALGYYRLLWDYAGGNPGVALHMWGRSLGCDADGRACVGIFRAPATDDLERLPDATIFVLRAVVQLELARRDDIARATRLGHGQVDDALRYGLARGYFEIVDDRYRVSWTWFRPITRFLQRRHLLASR
jgi:hypothetical protein